MKSKTRVAYLLAGILALCLVCACAGLAGLAGRDFIGRATVSPLRSALPATAEDIHEWSWDEGGPLAQDYDYVLKAKITQSEFDQYVRDFKLTPHTPGRRYTEPFEPDWELGWLWDMDNNGVRPEWFTATTDLSGTYVYDGGSSWIYAKYENGYIYVVAFNI